MVLITFSGSMNGLGGAFVIHLMTCTNKQIITERLMWTRSMCRAVCVLRLDVAHVYHSYLQNMEHF